MERLQGEEVGGGDVREDVGAFPGGAEVRNGCGGEGREGGVCRARRARGR